MAGETQGQTSTSAQLAALGQVTGELLHDLANEFTVLHGWALLAQGEADAGRLPSTEAQRVVEISASLGQMLRDALATLSGQALSPEVSFDPLAVTEEVLERRVRVLSGVTLRLQTELPPEVRVAGRSSFWVRVLANLLGNAARHARRKILVSLRLDEDSGGRRVVLRVEDDGAGIDAQQREEVFRPFARGADGETGLGLSSVAWAVAQLRGEVRYRDGSPLGGAAFEVRVPTLAPLVGAGAERPADAPAKVGELAGLRVLLVDDDRAVRRSVARLLCRAGCDARELDPQGEPEEQLIQAMVRALPDVILLDLRLGERGGVALWQRMHAGMRRLAGRVAFVTGAAPGDPDRRRAEETGQPVIGKPFGLEQLAEAVRQIRAGP